MTTESWALKPYVSCFLSSLSFISPLKVSRGKAKLSRDQSIVKMCLLVGDDKGFSRKLPVFDNRAACCDLFEIINRSKSTSFSLVDPNSGNGEKGDLKLNV